MLSHIKSPNLQKQTVLARTALFFFIYQIKFNENAKLSEVASGFENLNSELWQYYRANLSFEKLKIAQDAITQILTAGGFYADNMIRSICTAAYYEINYGPVQLDKNETIRDYIHIAKNFISNESANFIKFILCNHV